MIPGHLTPVPRISPDGTPAVLSYADVNFAHRPGNASEHKQHTVGAGACRCSLTWDALFSSKIPHQLPRGIPSPECVLGRCEVHDLLQHLPPRYHEAPWVLMFDTEHDGNSMAQFYRRLTEFEAEHRGERGCAAVGLITITPRTLPSVMTSPLDRQPDFISSSKPIVIGAFTPEMPSHYHTGSHCFGSKETTVFSFRPSDDTPSTYRSLHYYKWSGVNEEFLVCSPEFLGVGGGSNGAAIFLDSNLEYGTTSQHCTTFGSPSLAGEVWGGKENSEGLAHTEFIIQRMQWFALDLHAVRKAPPAPTNAAVPLCGCDRPSSQHQCVM